MITVNPKVIPTLLPAPDSDGKQLEFKALPFMSPWMFIPTYLEVCYQTCSTVFLRAPLAQQQMEIPSPYPPSWHQLVFEYYASIKRKQTREPVKEVLNIQGNDVRLKPKFDKIVRGDLKAKAEKLKQVRREKLAAFVAREKSEYKKQGHSI